MSKTIMISGPHAIGKSTTAEKLAEKHDLFYVSSFAGRIAKETGYDLNSNPSPEEVIQYQRAVLKAFQMHYDMTLEQSTVYDRSPLDFAVYTMLQLRNEPAYAKQVAEYVGECIRTTTAYCDLLVLPQADLTIPYEDKGNRPTFSDEQVKYRQAYQSILNDLASQVKLIETMQVPMEHQYDDRVNFISDYLED